MERAVRRVDPGAGVGRARFDMNRTGHTIQQRVGPRRGGRQRELQQPGEQQASADSPRVRFPLLTL